MEARASGSGSNTIIHENGIVWFGYGTLIPHRSNGPSRIYPNGDILFWVDGYLHRELAAGPAVILYEDDGSITHKYFRSGVRVDPLLVFSLTGDS